MTLCDAYRDDQIASPFRRLHLRAYEPLDGSRRWPVVTISLVLINVAAYLYTYPQIISQESTLSFARQDVLSLAARHPELKLPPAAAEFVDDVQASDPAAWAALQTPSLWAVDQFDLSVRTMTRCV